MASKFDEMLQSVEEAEQTMRIANQLANKIAKLLIGRLRKVTGYNVLKDIKKELTQYNASTGEWKS